MIDFRLPCQKEGRAIKQIYFDTYGKGIACTHTHILQPMQYATFRHSILNDAYPSVNQTV